MLLRLIGIHSPKSIGSCVYTHGAPILRRLTSIVDSYNLGIATDLVIAEHRGATVHLLPYLLLKPTQPLHVLILLLLLLVIKQLGLNSALEWGRSH